MFSQEVSVPSTGSELKWRVELDVGTSNLGEDWRRSFEPGIPVKYTVERILELEGLKTVTDIILASLS